MNTLQICPPHLSDVATGISGFSFIAEAARTPNDLKLSCFKEIPKVISQHYYKYISDYLRYLRRKHIATVLLQP